MWALIHLFSKTLLKITLVELKVYRRHYRRMDIRDLEVFKASKNKSKRKVDLVF